MLAILLDTTYAPPQRQPGAGVPHGPRLERGLQSRGCVDSLVAGVPDV